MTIHARSGGFNIFIHEHCTYGGACVQSPGLWATVTSAGWSFAASRQHVADVDGDGFDDLISVHRGGTGELIWRHINESFGSLLDVDDSFQAPELLADLRRGGWNWSVSREGVADTWGLMIN